jgi:hypothetical protein
VVVGDFNGDGIPDLAVNNGGASKLAILLGNGDGTFTLKGNVGLPQIDGGFIGSGGTLRAADFNGDGKLDLAVLNSDSDGYTGVTAEVYILLGNGDGTFALNNTVTTGPPASQYDIQVTDLNGDGIPDLLLLNQVLGSPPEIVTFLGNGNGTFANEATRSWGTAANYQMALALMDFNGDGKLDVIVVTEPSTPPNNITVFLSNGDGTVSTPTTIATFPVGGDGFSVAAVADFNGDGIADLAFVTSDGDGSSTPDHLLAYLQTFSSTATASASGISIPGSGTHNIQAFYSGDTTYTDSWSSTTPLTALPSATTTTLTVSPASAVSSGTNVQLTATISPSSVGNETPTGTMKFYDSSTQIGTGTVSGAQAVFSTSTLSLGSHSLSATYPGDINFLTSTSFVDPLTVSKQPVTVTIGSSKNPANFGDSITLTITLTGSGPVPTGTVTLTDGATNLGTLPLDGTGKTTYTTASIVTGSHALTATYNGDSNYY